jgi:hypothetical protein
VEKGIFKSKKDKKELVSILSKLYYYFDKNRSGAIQPDDIKVGFAELDANKNKKIESTEFTSVVNTALEEFCYQADLINDDGTCPGDKLLDSCDEEDENPKKRQIQKQKSPNHQSRRPQRLTLYSLFDRNLDNTIILREFFFTFSSMDKNKNYAVSPDEMVLFLKAKKEVICGPFEKKVAERLMNGNGCDLTGVTGGEEIENDVDIDVVPIGDGGSDEIVPDLNIDPVIDGETDSDEISESDEEETGDGPTISVDVIVDEDEDSIDQDEMDEATNIGPNTPEPPKESDDDMDFSDLSELELEENTPNPVQPPIEVPIKYEITSEPEPTSNPKSEPKPEVKSVVKPGKSKVISAPKPHVQKGEPEDAELSSSFRKNPAIVEVPPEKKSKDE